MKIHQINFQIAASCVISVYDSWRKNEQLYVLTDPASSSSGLVSSCKDDVLGKLVSLSAESRGRKSQSTFTIMWGGRSLVH